MSKAAMINLTLQLAHEMAPRVRVNAIAPAVVKTRFAQASTRAVSRRPPRRTRSAGWGSRRTSGARRHSSHLHKRNG